MKNFIIACVCLLSFVAGALVADARPHLPRLPRRPRKPPKAQMFEQPNVYKLVDHFDVLLLKYGDEENSRNMQHIMDEAMKEHHVNRTILYPDSQIPILVSQFTYEKLKKDKIDFLRLSPSFEDGRNHNNQTDIVQN